jgi:hypothetical protein
MATTYLQLSNELLRELNEVPLTAANFADAIGIQAHVKDCVNRAYMDIVTDEPRWPFLAAAESGTVDPMFGNVSVTTTAGTRWYELKEASTSLVNDYGAIDWENFLITTIGVSGETSPYLSKNLRYMSLETWKDFRRNSENLDDADNQNWGVPNAVIRSLDGRKFGLSPIPDKPYKIWFFAWNAPTRLSAYADTLLFPDMYASVIVAKARYYMWQFKDNPQAAAFALEDYKKGLRSMREALLDPAPNYIKDDRMVFV